MTRAVYVAILISALATGCGNGKWGAEISLGMGGIDESGAALSAGDTLTLQGGAWSLTVERACLAVESTTLTPAAGEAEPGGEDCFCHGDPPHCHGECGDAGTAAAQRPIFSSINRVVDLLGTPQEILRHGAAPAEFVRVAFAFSEAEAWSEPPAACADMQGRMFLLQGTLTETATGATWPLTVDLRANDKITDTVVADPAAVATVDQAARLAVFLRLDRAFDPVDLTAVTADATGPLTIGGELSERIVAVGQVIDGLTAGASFTAAAGN